MNIGLAAACLAAFSVALLTAWLVAKTAPRIGMIDRPNPRGSHDRNTPRGGGLGVIAGTAIGLALLSALGMAPSERLWILMSGALAIGVLGALDDFRSLGAGVRLVLQVVISSGVSYGLGGIPQLPLPAPLDLNTGLAAVPLGALWLAAMTNFYNFMDGIDGLASGQALASSVGIGLAGWAVDAGHAAAVLGSSVLGFLLLNLPPAKVFLGDVGSTSIGFTLAGLALIAGPMHRSTAVLAVGVGLALFILDPMETLIRLVRRGHRLGVAHRQHSYQVLARAYRSHGRVAAAITGAGFALAIIGAIAFRVPALGWVTVVAALVTFSLERYLASRASLKPANVGA